MIVKIDERALYALGFDAAGVAAMRHLVRMVGSVQASQTLPETIMQAALTSGDNSGPAVAELRKEVEALRMQVAALQSSAAALAEVRKNAESYAVRAMFPAQATDWEHPGKLGDKTPNTAKITVLNVDPAAIGTAAFPSYYFSIDTTTGLYRPGADQLAFTAAGALVATWSATGAAYKQNISTEKQLISTVATGTAPLQVSSTTLVANLHAAVADSLGTASSYSADATDLPSAITLVNELKAAANNKGL